MSTALVAAPSAAGARAPSPHTGAAVRKIHPAAGVVPRGSFSCEARCFCPCGDVVWVAERCGHIGIRCSRTGELKDTIIPNSSASTFGSAMIQTGHGDELWMGTTDGRIVVFNTVSKDQVAELRNLEAEKSGEVTGFAMEGVHLFASYGSGRVIRWNTRSKEMMGTLTHAAAVHALVLYGGVVYTGDVTGCITAFDAKTGERLTHNDEHSSGISVLLVEPTEKVLWAAHTDGKISVLTLVHPFLSLVGQRINDCHQRITTMVSVGGKVWAAGVDRTTYVWQARSRVILAKFRDHTAFVFQIAKLYNMETSRLWSLSNDKTVHMYDAEGFFFPVHSSAAQNEELFAAHATIQQLRVEISLLEKKLHLESDKVISRDTELEKCRDEINKLLMKSAALQHAVDLKEEAIHGNQADHTRLQSEYSQLNHKVSEMTMAVTQAEHEKSVLRGEVARTEEVLTRVRTQLADKTSQAAIFEAERNALATDKARLQQDIIARDNALATAATEARMFKDEIVSKNVDLARKDRELESAKQRVAELESHVGKIEEAKRQSEEARRRLDDTVIVREAQLRDLEAHLKHLQQTYGQKEIDFHQISQLRSHETHEAARLQDTFMLKSHQFDLLRNERENLDKTLSHERQQLAEARGNENRLRVQNEELRRQLDVEKNNVKLLEDQYTIFQFVINSRGELVNSIWGLHGKLVNATKYLRTLDQGIKSIDPTKDRMTLKRDWKTSVVDRAVQSVSSVDEVQRTVDYIVANYLSEYEKLHLGISTARFMPDTKRPAVVGDQLLTKLRDVTLMKQFAHPGKSSLNSSLPPPVSSSLGPQHITVPAPSAATQQHGAASVNYGGYGGGTSFTAQQGATPSFGYGGGAGTGLGVITVPAPTPAVATGHPSTAFGGAAGSYPGAAATAGGFTAGGGVGNQTTLLSSFQSTDLSALSATGAAPVATAGSVPLGSGNVNATQIPKPATAAAASAPPSASYSTYTPYAAPGLGAGSIQPASQVSSTTTSVSNPTVSSATPAVSSYATSGIPAAAPAGTTTSYYSSYTTSSSVPPPSASSVPAAHAALGVAVSASTGVPYQAPSTTNTAPITTYTQPQPTSTTGYTTTNPYAPSPYTAASTVGTAAGATTSSAAVPIPASVAAMGAMQYSSVVTTTTASPYASSYATTGAPTASSGYPAPTGSYAQPLPAPVVAPLGPV